jgi:reactive chlorine resistance protein C
MTSDQTRPRTDSSATTSAIAVAAGVLARYGLALVIAWIGALKFTSYEAQGIQPLVANSPLMSWLYDIFTLHTFSALLGVVEIATAVLLCVKPWWPRISYGRQCDGDRALLGHPQLLVHHTRSGRSIGRRVSGVIG